MENVSDLKKGELKDITFYNPNPINQASNFIEMWGKMDTHG